MQTKTESGAIDFNGSGTLSLQLREILENKIRNRELKIGEKFPPQEQLRKIYGVSNHTIEAALAGLIKEGFITRRPRHGTVVINYRPSKQAELKKNSSICVVICTNPLVKETGNPAIDIILTGIERKINESSLLLVYKTLDEGTGPDSRLDFGDKEKDIAGLIVVGNISQKHLSIINRTKIPYALIGDPYERSNTDKEVDVVGNDDFQSAYLAAKHLVGLGHKRIACFSISFKRYFWEIEHLKGYKQALKESNIEFNKNLLIESNSNNTGECHAAMNKFLDKKLHFTGLICLVNINLYFAALKAFSEKNLWVPDNISVVCNQQFPGVASVSIDHKDMGRAAAERIIERLINPQWKPERVIVPFKLIEGGSTKKI